jgi:hypothetical protein
MKLKKEESFRMKEASSALEGSPFTKNGASKNEHRFLRHQRHNHDGMGT